MSITTTQPAPRPLLLGADSPSAPLLLAVPDAARLLGIGTTLAWDLVRAGKIPSVKLGRRVLIPRTVLERLAHATEAGEHGPDGHLDASHDLLPPMTHVRR